MIKVAVVKNILHDKKINKIILLIFFLGFFLFGIFSYKDYGVSIDEEVQRRHGLVNLKYICQLIDEDNVPQYLQDMPYNLKEYYFMKYYGIGAKIPLIIIEYLNNFEMTNQQIYYMNHLYTFLLFFVATIYVYRLLKLFGFNFFYSLLGTLLFIIYPRTLADSFYNIKDSVFLSLFVIMQYYGMAIIKNFNWRNAAGLVVSAAFCLNTRIVGALPLLFTILFYILSDRDGIKKRIFHTALVGTLSFAIYILISPAAWFEGINYVFNAVDVAADFKYTAITNVPWNYLLEMMMLTLPSSYIFFFLLGWGVSAKEVLFIYKRENFFKNLIFLQFTTIIIYDMIMKPIKYNMWRHFYFLLIYIVIFMLFGIQYLFQKDHYKKYIQVGLGLSIIMLLFWNLRFHPYEYLYFNPILSLFREEPELDYWNVAYNDVMRSIKDDSNIVVYKQEGTPILFLGEEGWEDYHESKESDGAEYVISQQSKNRSILYDKIYELVVDDRMIYSLQKRINYDNCLLKYFFTDNKEIIGNNAREEIEWEYIENGAEKGFDFYIPECYRVNQIDFWCRDIDSISNVKVYASENGNEWGTYDSTSVYCSEEMFAIISNDYIQQYVQIRFETLAPITITEMDINVYGTEIAEFAYIKANYNQEGIKYLYDRDINTRWSSNTFAEKGMYIEFALKEEGAIKGMTLDLGSSIYDFPVSPCIQGENSMNEWEDIPYVCKDYENFIFESPVLYKKYRIINQDSAAHYWSVHELKVYYENSAGWWNNIDTNNSILTLDSNYNSEDIAKMIDNNMETKWNSGTVQHEDMFVKIELKENENIAGFHLGAGTRFEMPRECQILGSYDDDRYENIVYHYGDSFDYIFESNCNYKYYMIKQIGSDDLYKWSIAELGILR